MDVGFLDIMEDYKTGPQPIFVNGACVTTTPNSSITNNSMTDTDIWNDASCGKGMKSDLLELITASIVADGLSRYGSHRAFNMLPDLRNWTFQDLPHTPDFNKSILSGSDAVIMPSDPSFVVQRMNLQAVGYAYQASSTSDYLATSVTCIYILIAGAHVLWVTCYGATSSSWDTITELLVLCHNSPPVSVLKSASAGIYHLATYNKVMQVRAESHPRTLHESYVVLVSAGGKRTYAEETDQSSSISPFSSGTDSVVERKRAALHFELMSSAANLGALSTLIFTSNPAAMLGFAYLSTKSSDQGTWQRRVEIDKKYH